MERVQSRQLGLSMIEVLVTIVILVVGLLGLAGLQGRANTAELESYQRVQTLVLLQDMVDRINANRKVASCYAFTDAATGAPYEGTGGAAATCLAGGTAAIRAVATQDLADFHALLNNSTASSVGALIGARGCISVDAAGSGAITVSVAWQGINTTAAPAAALTCATGLYGSEDRRRVVSTEILIANLAP